MLPSLAYDVHAGITKSAPAKMWQEGGFTSSYAYINSLDYSASGNWNNFTTITPYFAGTPNIIGRVAGGSALTSNGNLLYFGGKDSNGGSGTNDVWYSTNYGLNFTLAISNASWSARTDFSTAAMPGSRYVFMTGGTSASSNDATSLNDVWYSSDGFGIVWNQATPAAPYPPFADAAFVALYDSSFVSSTYTQTYSTLVLMVNMQDIVYSSVNGGVNWTIAGYVPWTPRQRAQFVADTDK